MHAPILRSLCESLVLALVFGLPAASQMKGTYTIDPSKPASTVNFQSFAAATNALTTGWVTGPVVFKVASTTFHEPIQLEPVNNTSAVNTVTFVAEGAPAVISPSVVNQRYGIFLAKKTRWIRFENLKITNYIDTGIYLDGDFSDPSKDCVFTRLEVDDGGTNWPSIRALTSPRARNCRFIECIFRSNHQPVYHIGARGCVYDRCEFDGKGLASRLVYLVFESNSPNSDAVFQNCFLHDCGSTGSGLVHDGIGANNLFLHNTIIVKTSGFAMQVAGPTPWSRAPIFKNNIAVNLGLGSAVHYDYAYSYDHIDVAVSDYNCFYAPHSKTTVQVGTPSNPVFAGSLAQFLAWQKAHPKNILPGGATAYDARSLEENPGLASLAPPQDIHLTRHSPLVGAGTLDLIPSYVNTPKWTVATDFEGDARIEPVDIGADEAGISITGSGSGAIGTVEWLHLSSQFDEGLRYQAATSLGLGPIFIGKRVLRLNFDAILFASINNLLPTVFQHYGGTLDATGRGTARIQIPNAVGLKGVKLYSAFVTIDLMAPDAIRGISNTFEFVIH